MIIVVQVFFSIFVKIYIFKKPGCFVQHSYRARKIFYENIELLWLVNCNAYVHIRSCSK